MPRPPRFTIRAASALTGINANTLRAWERRYGLVCPERTAKGYRLYTELDLEKLRLIQRATQRGISIGRVKEHLEDERSLESLLDERDHAPVSAVRTVEVSLAAAGLSGTTTIQLPTTRSAPHAGGTMAECSRLIETAAKRFDRASLDRAFARAVGTHSLSHAFYEALAPALARVGERYLANAANVAEEHFLTAFAREKLVSALAGLRPLHQQPRVLCATVANDLHEIGLMLLALELGLESVSTLYLGSSVPPEAIAHAAAGSSLRAVALSATLALPRESLIQTRECLEAHCKRARLFVGGPATRGQHDVLRAIGIEPLDDDPRRAAQQLLAAVGR